MYRASVDSDGQQIDADTVKDVLNFVDATMDEGTEVAEGDTRNEGRVGCRSWHGDGSEAG